MALIFLVLFCVPCILLVHELGHLFAARLFGVEVAQLSVGFGPKIVGYTDRLGTHWIFAAFPIGGMTIYGNGTGTTRRLSECSIPIRAAIYTAGSLFNFIFTIAIFVGVSSAKQGAVINFQSFDANDAFLFIIATLSIAVGIFNLLPIPPLDGWLLTLLLIERALRRRITDSEDNVIMRIGCGILALATGASLATAFALLW